MQPTILFSVLLGIGVFNVAIACPSTGGAAKIAISGVKVSSSSFATCTDASYPSTMNKSACCFSNTICGYNNQAATANVNKYFALKTDTCTYNSTTCATSGATFNLASCSCVTAGVVTTTPAYVTTTAAPGATTCGPAPADSTWNSPCIALNSTAPSSSSASNYYLVDGCTFTAATPCTSGYAFNPNSCGCAKIYNSCSVNIAGWEIYDLCQSDGQCAIGAAVGTATAKAVPPYYFSFAECSAALGKSSQFNYNSYFGTYNGISYKTNIPLFLCADGDYGKSYHCVDFPFKCDGNTQAIGLNGIYENGFTGCCEYLKNTNLNANPGQLINATVSVNSVFVNKCAIDTPMKTVVPTGGSSYNLCHTNGTFDNLGKFSIDLCQSDGRCTLNVTTQAWTGSGYGYDWTFGNWTVVNNYPTYAACQSSLPGVIDYLPATIAQYGLITYTMSPLANFVCLVAGSTNKFYAVDYPKYCFAGDAPTTSLNCGYLTMCNDMAYRGKTSTITWSKVNVYGELVSMCRVNF